MIPLIYTTCLVVIDRARAATYSVL